METIKYRDPYNSAILSELKNCMKETFSIGDRVACTPALYGNITIGLIDRETAKSITIIDEKTGVKRHLQKHSIFSNIRKLNK